MHDTHAALPGHQFVLRSDIKSYYNSIHFEILMAIIKTYVKHPILLTLITKACKRTETRGGIFYEYQESGIPKGSPLSLLLGAIALMPLDQAMGHINNVFYARFMDDWVVLTKSKTALRKVIKRTHQVIQSLKLKLHPLKTYIGKISHGFNFLAYYMDDQKILPSQETIRRFHERAVALYEHPHHNMPHRIHNPDRDISEYPVNETAPSDQMVKTIFSSLRVRTHNQRDHILRIRRYIDKWACWLRCGLSSIEAFAASVQTLLPSLFSCWSDGAQTFLA